MTTITMEQLEKFEFHDFIDLNYDKIRCPNCKGDNWKAAIHSNPDFSIVCHDCRHESSGEFKNHVAILNEWVKS